MPEPDRVARPAVTGAAWLAVLQLMLALAAGSLRAQEEAPEPADSLSELAGQHGVSLPDLEAPGRVHAVHLTDGSVLHGTLAALHAFAVVETAGPPASHPGSPEEPPEAPEELEQRAPGGEADGDSTPASGEVFFTERRVPRGDVRLVALRDVEDGASPGALDPHTDGLVTVAGETLSGPVTVREGTAHVAGQSLELSEVALIRLSDPHADDPRAPRWLRGAAGAREGDGEADGDAAGPGAEEEVASIPPGEACWHGHLVARQRWTGLPETEQIVLEIATREERSPERSGRVLRHEWIRYQYTSTIDAGLGRRYRPNPYTVEGVLTHFPESEYPPRYPGGHVRGDGTYDLWIAPLGQDPYSPEALGWPRRRHSYRTDGGWSPWIDALEPSIGGFQPGRREGVGRRDSLSEGGVSMGGSRTWENEDGRGLDEWHLRRVASCPAAPEEAAPEQREGCDCEYLRAQVEYHEEGISRLEQDLREATAELRGERDELRRMAERLERLKPWFRRAVGLAGAADVFKTLLSMGVGAELSAALRAAGATRSAVAAADVLMTVVTSDVVGAGAEDVPALVTPRLAGAQQKVASLEIAYRIMAGDRFEYDELLEYVAREFESLPGVGRDNPVSERAREYVDLLRTGYPATLRKALLLFQSKERLMGQLDGHRMDRAYWRQRLEACESCRG